MESDDKQLKMWTDGGSRGNPGKAAIGIVISDGQSVVFEEGRYLGDLISNNQAEYQALYRGLLELKEMGAKRVRCHLDSQLVVEQINGRYKVKDAGLREWWQKIQELMQSFESIEVVYVPRAQNAAADSLVNQALDERL